MKQKMLTRVRGVKFAENPVGTRGRFLYGSHGEPADQPMALDYLVWAIESGGHRVVVDTGFLASTSEERGRLYHRTPKDALALIEVDSDQIEHVVLSHLHYDHAGGTRYFPHAQFYVQEAEYEFWRSSYGKRGELAHSVEANDVRELEALDANGRLTLLAGDSEIVPGVSAHLVGGHTRGSQVVRVRAHDRTVVLACDASHFYQNIHEDIPFAVLHDLPGVYAAYDRIRELAGPGTIVPGHDPELFMRNRAVPGLKGIAFEVD